MYYLFFLIHCQDLKDTKGRFNFEVQSEVEKIEKRRKRNDTIRFSFKKFTAKPFRSCFVTRIKFSLFLDLLAHIFFT